MKTDVIQLCDGDPYMSVKGMDEIMKYINNEYPNHKETFEKYLFELL
jgi:hypothetical protein